MYHPELHITIKPQVGGYSANIAEYDVIKADGETIFEAMDNLSHAAKVYFRQEIPPIWRHEIKRLRHQWSRDDLENDRMVSLSDAEKVAAYLVLYQHEFTDFDDLYHVLHEGTSMGYPVIELVILKHHKKFVGLIKFDPHLYEVEYDDRESDWDD